SLDCGRMEDKDLSVLQSVDCLACVFSRALEGMAIIMKNSEPCRIQRALRSLDLERSNCLQFENSEEPSLRS
ncbi:hypothetical protein PMAYCL1PPCAC_27403, partial [Pristionchus mayeri]